LLWSFIPDSEQWSEDEGIQNLVRKKTEISPDFKGIAVREKEEATSFLNNFLGISLT